jgi:hypothetical protein
MCFWMVADIFLFYLFWIFVISVLRYLDAMKGSLLEWCPVSFTMFQVTDHKSKEAANGVHYWMYNFIHGLAKMFMTWEPSLVVFKGFLAVHQDKPQFETSSKKRVEDL